MFVLLELFLSVVKFLMLSSNYFNQEQEQEPEQGQEQERDQEHWEQFHLKFCLSLGLRYVRKGKC